MVDIFFLFYFYSIFFFFKKRKNLPIHEHSVFTDQNIESYELCSECEKYIWKGNSNYSCKICIKWWHKNCMPTSSKAVNHQYHPKHELKLLVGGVPEYADGKCNFCQEDIRNCVYHCSTCNFSLDVRCRYSSRPIKIKKSKSHDHPLTLLVRQVSFVCNACGMPGERNPYLCVACFFMVHVECIDLPHVININRHNHRISHTYSLRPGNKICKICRLDVNWMYGTYSCSKCPDLFVHSKCATHWSVWDGKELEGEKEEEEDKPMFTMIGENMINHVKHPSHNLKLIDNGVLCDGSIRCQLCQGLIYSDKFYSCIECNYILHETCAYATKRRRNVFSTSPLVLKKFVREADGNEFFKCFACSQPSIGYMYSSQSGYKSIDLRCAAIDSSCDHECHPHTLFFTTRAEEICGACELKRHVLRCVTDGCTFYLCYKCASYPKKIMHRCDDHPLVLRFGEDRELHGIHWCTICEAKIDLKKWFYECEECGIVGHIQCVLGDFTNFKPRLHRTKDGTKKGVVRNSSSTRPHCSLCSSRCLAPFIYTSSDKYYCSMDCSGWLTKMEEAVQFIELAALTFMDEM